MSDDKNVVQTVTLGTIAKVLMLTERRVNQLVKEGKLTKESRGRYQLIPNVQAYIRYWQNRSSGTDSAHNSDLHTEKTRLTKAQADKAELEAAELRGIMVNMDEAESKFADMAHTVKQKLLVVPSKAAPSVAAATNVSDIEDILKKEIHEVLEELVGEFA